MAAKHTQQHGCCARCVAYVSAFVRSCVHGMSFLTAGVRLAYRSMSYGSGSATDLFWVSACTKQVGARCRRGRLIVSSARACGIMYER